MAFRFDRLTLKSQEAVQSAQSLARDRGHQRIEPMHLLAALLDPEQQVIRTLLSQLGVNPAQVLKAAEEGLGALPKVTGGEQSLGPDLSAVLDTAQAEADRMKDQYVSVEHLLLGLVKVKSKAQQLLDALGVNEKEILQALQKVRGGQTVTDQNPDDKYQALTALRPRPRRAGPQGQNGSGDRPRRRDPPGGAGAQPANQEQPGLDRRTRRGQDRHR